MFPAGDLDRELNEVSSSLTQLQVRLINRSLSSMIELSWWPQTLPYCQHIRFVHAHRHMHAYGHLFLCIYLRLDIDFPPLDLQFCSPRKFRVLVHNGLLKLASAECFIKSLKASHNFKILTRLWLVENSFLKTLKWNPPRQFCVAQVFIVSISVLRQAVPL